MKRANETKSPVGEVRMDIPRGVYLNASSVTKFGVLPTMDTTDSASDVWEHGILEPVYMYDNWKTAPIERIISTAAGDTNITIRVEGLDIDGNLVVQYPILMGASDVLLDTPLWRVFRMINVSTDEATGTGKSITGTVSAFTGDTHASGVPPANAVRAQILGGNNQTQMALYTIPKGMTGYIVDAGAGMAKGGQTASSAVVSLRARAWLSVFTVQKTIAVVSAGSSNFQAQTGMWQKVGELTDIKIVVESVSTNGTGIWGSFTIVLVDETEEAKQ